MELTPREVAPSRSRRRSPVAYVVLAVVVLALGFVVWNGLNNATVYFRTADQAVADHAKLGDKRFRLEGTVVKNSVADNGDQVRFLVESNGVNVDVLHIGDPPELFREGIPVVLEGRWAQGDAIVFNSDRIIVKHGNKYEAEHPDRVKDYTTNR